MIRCLLNKVPSRDRKRPPYPELFTLIALVLSSLSSEKHKLQSQVRMVKDPREGMGCWDWQTENL